MPLEHPAVKQKQLVLQGFPVGFVHYLTCLLLAEQGCILCAGFNWNILLHKQGLLKLAL